MRKTPPLFQFAVVEDRKSDRGACLDVVTPGCEWVLAGEGVATRKWDGTSCAVIDGKLYARFDGKNSKGLVPEGAVHCGDETERGKHIYWVPVGIQPQFKWHLEAWVTNATQLADGTYELIGPRINRNPDRAEAHVFRRHGDTVFNDAPRTHSGLKEYLSRLDAEGVVFHHPDGRMAKIRRSDFRLPWPLKSEARR